MNPIGYVSDSIHHSVEALMQWPPNPLLGVTLVAGFVSTGRVAYLYFHKKKVLKYGDILISVTCWVGHDGLKKEIVLRILAHEREAFKRILDESKTQLKREKELNQELQEKLSKLEKGGAEVHQAADRIKELVHSTEEIGEKDKKSLEEQKKAVNEMELQLSRLNGFLRVAREEQEELDQKNAVAEERNRELARDFEKLVEKLESITKELGQVQPVLKKGE